MPKELLWQVRPVKRGAVQITFECIVDAKLIPVFEVSLPKAFPHARFTKPSYMGARADTKNGLTFVYHVSVRIKRTRDIEETLEQVFRWLRTTARIDTLYLFLPAIPKQLLNALRRTERAKHLRPRRTVC